MRPSRFFASVILMATEKINNDANVKNIYVLFPLLPTGADLIKHLDDAIKSKKIFVKYLIRFIPQCSYGQIQNYFFLSLVASTDAFENEYGTGDFCLSDGLWIATTLFQES